MHIRPVKADDIPAVQRVARLSWAHAYSGIYPPEYIEAFVERAYSFQSLEQSISRDEGDEERKFLVAELEGAGVIGFLHMRKVDERTHELLRIYLLPEHQGEGAGTRLLHEAVRRNAVRRLEAWVEGQNASARRFYEGKGFRAIRYETQTFSGYTTQLVVYEKDYGRAIG